MNNLIKKGVAVAVILLFVSVSVIPSTGTNVLERTSTVSFDGNILYVGGSGPNNYTKIQDAINDSSDGDTVFVYDDSSPYYENLVVDKSIHLIGEDRNTTIIDGSRISRVVTINASCVNISGFTISNSGGNYSNAGVVIISDYNTITGNNINSNNNYGIYLGDSSDNTINGNNISSNNWGGIRLTGSNNNTIAGNSITKNHNGIVLEDSIGNTITGNNIILNNGGGIILDESGGNTITSNTVTSNRDNGIWLVCSSGNTIAGNTISNTEYHGIRLYFSSGNTITSNTVTSNIDNGISLVVSSYNTITGNTVTSNIDNGISLEDSSYNTFTSNSIILNNGSGIDIGHYSNNNAINSNNINSNNNYGIYLGDSSDNTINGNNISSNNWDGIRLTGSNNNTISGNKITNNYDGILLYKASNNIISENIISNNTIGIGNIMDAISENALSNAWYGIFIFNSSNNIISENTTSSNYLDGIILVQQSINNIFYHNNFINNTYQAYDNSNNNWDNGYPSGGNYWDDYNGVDNDGDDIGDTPYKIQGGDNQDKYPLMEPYGMTKLTMNIGWGLLKFFGGIKNIGNKTAFNVQWKITIDGGFIIVGRHSSGTLPKPLLVGEETTLSSGIVLGFGPIMITIAVWADNAPLISESIPGTLFLIFLML